MTETVHAGPIVSIGTLLGSPGAPDTNEKAGPSLFFQGVGILDPRATFLNRGIGSVPSFLIRTDIRVADQYPVASSATPTGIASVQNVTNGTAMTLSGPNAAIPFVPAVGGLPITPALTLDFGFGLVATTAGSGTVTPSAALMPYFQQGQSIVIADVGNAGGTAPLFAKVTAVGATTITVSPAPQATNATTHAGQGNIMSPMASAMPVAQAPYLEGGLGAFFDPTQGGLSRGIAIGGSTGATGGNFLVSGWDVWGVAMSELITVGAGAVSGYGKKAFKHIGSVVPQFTDAHNYSVGPSDVVGFALRNDAWQYNEIYVGSALLTATTGYTAAFSGTSTTTTGDVRGTIQTGPRGPLGSGATGGSLDGSTKVTVTLSLPLISMIGAGQGSAPSIFGVPQA